MIRKATGNRRRFWRLTFVTLLAISSVHAVPPIPVNDPVEGEKLAGELRKAAPTASGQLTGTLKVLSSGQTTFVAPLKSSVTITASNWFNTYTVMPSNGPQETLIIRHATGKPTQYEWRRGETVLLLSGSQATNRFAGSDFALLDLGLEFFHWPTQKLAFREMRKGRGCDVLESKPEQPVFYSTVLSWIDQESRAQGIPGILMAEAKDVRGKPLKEFEIRKVTRRGELREIEIRNVQTNTTTRIQFDSAEE